MDIKKCHIGQRVRAKSGCEGKIIKIESGNPSGFLTTLEDSGQIGYDHAALFVPVSDPCAPCEMAATITSQCKQIADLQGKLDRAGGKIKELKEVLYRDNRNAAYWREELEKLQKEALAESPKLHWHKIDMMIGVDEMAPIGMIAKCYIQVEPEKLLMSQEARRVLHLLETEGAQDYRDIAATFGGDWGKTMDGIIELLDAGKISLVNGKYEIVRD